MYYLLNYQSNPLKNILPYLHLWQKKLKLLRITQVVNVEFTNLKAYNPNQ